MDWPEPHSHKRCHDDSKREQTPRTRVGLRLRWSISRKDVLMLSHFLIGCSLHFWYYCWFIISRVTSDVMLLEHVLFVSFWSIHTSQTEVESSLPNGHSLFLLSLYCLSLPHSYHSVYIGLIVTEENTVQFSTCVAQSPCNTITFIPSTDHSPANTFTFKWPFTHTTSTCYHTTTYRYMCIKMYSLHSTANVCLHAARIHGYILRNVLHVYLLYAFPT